MNEKHAKEKKLWANVKNVQNRNLKGCVQESALFCFVSFAKTMQLYFVS